MIEKFGGIVVLASVLLNGLSACAVDASAKFRVAQWNIGHFAMGKSCSTSIAAAESRERATKYRAKIASLKADFIGVSEYDPIFDTAGMPATNAVFASYPTAVAGPKNAYQCNAVFSRLPCVRHEVVDFCDRGQQTYFLDAVFKVGTNDVHFVQSHLDWNSNEKATDARPRQIRQLITHFKNVPYVIICADFNVCGAGEYKPFVMAGFTLANCGAAGCLETYPGKDELMPCRRYPLDNIIVKGFKVSDVKIDDKDLTLSDHRIIACNLEMVAQ